MPTVTDTSSSVTFCFSKRYIPGLYAGGIILNILLFYFLQVYHFGIEDVDMEVAPLPVAVGCLEQARSEGLPLKTYLARNEWCIDFVREVANARSFPGNIISCEYFVYAEPMGIVAYLPFIKLFGVGLRTVEIYGCFWTFACLVLLFLIVRLILGKWYDILAVLFLQSSVIWLIHAKLGNSQWMPTVFLTLGIVLCVYYYWTTNRPLAILSAAAILGILCGELWIGFFLNGCLIGLAILLQWKARRWRIFADYLMVGIVVAVTFFSFISIYASIFHVQISDIYMTIFNSAFRRFNQGGIPAFQPSLWGKLCYAMKCLFVDSTQMDHDNKYLEGAPAVSWIFTVFFFVGLILVLKRRSVTDRWILLWIATCFFAMTFVYLFAHRYSLLLLPAMAIMAAIGVIDPLCMCMKKYKAGYVLVLAMVLTGLILFTHYQTYSQYYGKYTLHKKVSFENDRIRGHAKVADWIKSNCNSSRTLIVLSDYIMTDWATYRFNTYDRNYRFVYWNNYIKGSASELQIHEWIQSLLKLYEDVCFVFSTQLMGNPLTGECFNDWRPFVRAYPGMKPSFVYSYDNRTLLVVFRIRSKS